MQQITGRTLGTTTGLVPRSHPAVTIRSSSTSDPSRRILTILYFGTRTIGHQSTERYVQRRRLLVDQGSSCVSDSSTEHSYDVDSKQRLIRPLIRLNNRRPQRRRYNPNRHHNNNSRHRRGRSNRSPSHPLRVDRLHRNSEGLVHAQRTQRNLFA